MSKPHNDLVKASLGWLELHGIFAWSNNTGAYKIGKRFIRFSTPGASDIIGVQPVIITPEMVGVTVGQFLGAEIKIGRDRLSADQHIWATAVRGAGGRFVECRSLDDLERTLGDE